MRRAWPFALAAAIGVIAFFIGRYVGQRPIAGLEARLADAERERAVAHEVQAEVSGAVARAMTTPRVDGTTVQPPAPLQPSSSPLSPEDEISKLMDRLNELTDKLDGGFEVDMGAEHAADARKLRDQLFDKAHLDEDQRAAIDPIVAELDRTLAGPLDRLAKLEDADHYAVSDWAQARVELYQAIAASEQQLRALLSPQQREALDQTNFTLTSQLSEERYEALAGRGIVPPDNLDDIVDGAAIPR